MTDGSMHVEPEQPPHWAWSQNPDTEQGLVHDTTGAIVAYCTDASIARRIVVSVNTFGNTPLPPQEGA